MYTNNSLLGYTTEGKISFIIATNDKVPRNQHNKKCA